MPLPL